MKSTIEDRIKLLAAAQENMSYVADQIADWDKSQLTMEKSAFDSMNVSDNVLNLSKEGSRLVDRLLECSCEIMKYPTPEENKKVAAVLEDIHKVFGNISRASMSVSEISHKIEGEAAAQKEMQEEIRRSLSQVSDSLDSAIACAEMVLAEE